jgi:hypothetical protein
MPQVGAPLTYVTTPAFLARFGMHSLRDLPEIEGARDALPIDVSAERASADDLSLVDDAEEDEALEPLADK